MSSLEAVGWLVYLIGAPVVMLAIIAMDYWESRS